MPDELALRPATPGDAAYLARMVHTHLGPIVNAAWRDPLGSQRVLDYIGSAGTCLVACLEGQDAAIIHLEPRRDQLHIGALVVDQPFRRRGLGRRLLQWTEQQALRLGLPHLGLWVETNNPGALRLYKEAGFDTAGAPRENTLAMLKPIHPPDDRLDPLALTSAMARAARTAGDAIREAFRRRQVVSEKSARDLLAEADLIAERLILAELGQRYPDFNVCAEESGSRGQGSPYTWVIDPLDGTNNFVLGVPYFSVSIALLHAPGTAGSPPAATLAAHGEPCAGVVFQPMLGEMFTAQAGAGAWQDVRPLRPAGAPPLARAVVSWVQGHRVGPAHPAAAALRQAVECGCRRLISTWAPALDWCLLARGDVAGLISYDSEPEDQLAGALIAREAGTLVTDFTGRPWRPGERWVLAATHPQVHAGLQDLLRPASSQPHKSDSELRKPWQEPLA